MSTFHFKYFSVQQSNAGLKVGTDAMLLGALIAADGKVRGIDIGTGTGVLSLMVAQRNQQIKIDAVEKEDGAIYDARENFRNSPYSDRLKGFHEDFLDFSSDEKYDLVFSNPPFYENAKLGDDAKLNDAKHVGGLNPQALLSKVVKILSDNGSLWLIWPNQSSELLIEKALTEGLILQQRITIFGKTKNPTRVILKFGFEATQVHNRGFTIREDSGQYTYEYKELTKEFHNKKL